MCEESNFTPDFGAYDVVVVVVVVVAGVDRARVTVGDNLKVIFNFIRQDATAKKITYLVRFSVPAYHTHQLSPFSEQVT